MRGRLIYLSTPHGTLGTDEYDKNYEPKYAFNSTRYIRNHIQEGAVLGVSQKPFNSTRYIRNLQAYGDLMPTYLRAFNSTRYIRNMCAKSSQAKLSQVDLSTPHGTLGTWSC